MIAMLRNRYSYIRDGDSQLLVERERRSRILNNERTTESIDILPFVVGMIPIRASLIYLMHVRE